MHCFWQQKRASTYQGVRPSSLWWAMRDSNPRLSPRQEDTLPAELIARIELAF